MRQRRDPRIEREIDSILVPGHARGRVRENAVVDLLNLRARPMSLGELRDAIGGTQDDIRVILEQAISMGRVRSAELIGEPLFSPVRFEIVPIGETSKIPKQRAPRRTRRTRSTSPSKSSQISDPADNVTRAALRLAGGRGRRVMLTDLRRALPSITRREFDDLLVAMSRDGRVALFPNDDQYSITDQDVRDAVNLSGVQQHILYLA